MGSLPGRSPARPSATQCSKPALFLHVGRMRCLRRPMACTPCMAGALALLRFTDTGCPLLLAPGVQEVHEQLSAAWDQYGLNFMDTAGVGWLGGLMGDASCPDGQAVGFTYTAMAALPLLGHRSFLAPSHLTLPARHLPPIHSSHPLVHTPPPPMQRSTPSRPRPRRREPLSATSARGWPRAAPSARTLCWPPRCRGEQPGGRGLACPVLRRG